MRASWKLTGVLLITTLACATSEHSATAQELPAPREVIEAVPPSVPTQAPAIKQLPLINDRKDNQLPPLPPGVPGVKAPQPKFSDFPPAPQPIEPAGPKPFRTPMAKDLPRVLGNTPQAAPETVNRYGNYVKEFVDPEMTLDLIAGRTRLMLLKQTPKRIQIADDTVAGYTILTPNEISLLGRHVGITVLTMWFADPKVEGKENILTYYVRTMPDPEARERLERVYKDLTDQINRAFPDSVVKLQLVGDKVVVSGNAKDIADVTHIMRIVRANVPQAGYRNGNKAKDASQIPVNQMRPEAPGGPTAPPGLENYEVAENNPSVINLLRVNGEQQVMLKVTVAEVNRSAARSIGLNFAVLNQQGQTVFANTTGSIVTGGLTPTGFGYGYGGFGNALNTLNNGLISQGFTNLSGVLDSGRVLLAVSALRNLNYARSLAEPNLVTLNGQTAQFQAGGEFPVPIVSGYTSYGLQGVNFIPYGVQLSFTPYITDRDRVRLVIAAEVSARDLSAGTTFIGGAAVPSLSTRNFRTTVELREGQTMAVAGLIQTNLGADSTRVPLLGDFPVLGRLFAFDQTSAGDQELVVLVTPELVHPMNHKEVPPLPGSDIFEPSDCEFYLLGRLESQYGVDFRSPYRTDWQRLRSYRKYENMYIHGPTGPGDVP